MTPRQWSMVAALTGAAALALFGDKTPNTEVAEAVVRGTTAAARAPKAAKTAAKAEPVEAVILALRPRADLIGEAGEFGAADALFLSQNWTPPPPKPPPPPPPPAPSAPPLPFTYIGKAVGDGNWEVFLARGDQTYIVRNQSVIDGAYRVDSIAPPLLKLTYLPLNQVQQINIGVTD
ncbi:hypothetical protein AAKU55_005188 [Oxalobacteraceae bacterium GrIS 1.11]